MSTNKPRIVKDFEKLEPEIQDQIKLAYPEGFHQNLISYYDKEGLRRSALPFETEDKYYLVRMSVVEAKRIIEDDQDYDAEGHLRPEVQEDLEGKYQDMAGMEEDEEEEAEDYDVAESSDEDEEED